MSLLELQNVSKSYQTSDYTVRAVRKVSLSIEKGETVAFVGPSGSGKSTLLNIAGLVILPDKGKVLLNGEDVTNLSDAKCCALRNQTFGYVVQDFALIEDETVYNNIRLPLLYNKSVPRSEWKKRITEAAKSLGIENKLNRPVVKLSGGERQRVAIARAIVCGQPILMADEPTGSLDAENKALVMDLMVKLVEERGMTLLVVTHDREVAERCQRVVRMSGGRLEE
ncbi:MAG: ABC transporter ATP-binding protein [Lachnospiraceae bacterium]|nr:ABC transporter ATP-binding protein [Lachnospiraceae bacterium]